MADPAQNGEDAEMQIINVSLPGSYVGVRKRRPKRAKRPHSKFSGCKALNGPAMRPRITPLAVENGVGKLAANLAPNVSPGKREWRTPIPIFVPV